MDYEVGYCTNVHAGTTLEQVRSNLVQFSEQVKSQVTPESPLGIGMWFSATSALELEDEAKLQSLRQYLDDAGLYPFTFNGFPFGNFHEQVVKHRVYLPTWADTERLDYTNRLARIQSQLLPEGATGSISTLPIGWPKDGFSRTWNQGDLETVEHSAKQFKKCAEHLKGIFETTGRKIQLAIEPEPGCLIDNKIGAIAFFETYLNEPWLRDYLGICHDICHSAVMFEPQQEALKSYRDNEIHVFKVQVSSAIEIDFEKLDESQRMEGRDQLASFAEDRYLHQTSVEQEGEPLLFEDLNLALERGDLRGKWRVHFHVPLYADQLDWIGTTQRDVIECLEGMRAYHPSSRHFEVETYAWNVLPAAYQHESLSSGIARELNWFFEQIKCR